MAAEWEKLATELKGEIPVAKVWPPAPFTGAIITRHLIVMSDVIYIG